MSRGKNVRWFTVTTRASWPTHRQVPQIRMSGDWLGQAGFTPGCWLDVEVKPGRLVVTLAGDPDPAVVQLAVAELQRAYRLRPKC